MQQRDYHNYAERSRGSASNQHRLSSVILVSPDDPKYIAWRAEKISDEVVARWSTLRFPSEKPSLDQARRVLGEESEAIIRDWLSTHLELTPKRVIHANFGQECAVENRYYETDAISIKNARPNFIFEIKTCLQAHYPSGSMRQLRARQAVLAWKFGKIDCVAIRVRPLISIASNQTSIVLRELPSSASAFNEILRSAGTEPIVIPFGVLAYYGRKIGKPFSNATIDYFKSQLEERYRLRDAYAFERLLDLNQVALQLEYYLEKKIITAREKADVESLHIIDRAARMLELKERRYPPLTYEDEISALP